MPVSVFAMPKLQVRDGPDSDMLRTCLNDANDPTLTSAGSFTDTHIPAIVLQHPPKFYRKPKIADDQSFADG
jgi:hypothetical protein